MSTMALIGIGMFLAWLGLVFGLLWHAELSMPNETIVFGEYALRTIGMISLLPDVLHGAKILYAPTMRKRRRPRLGKKQRRRIRKWFGRRPRSRWRGRTTSCPTSENSDDDSWDWAGTKSEWIDDWFDHHRHRFLHRIGFQEEFASIMNRFPTFDWFDFDDLLELRHHTRWKWQTRMDWSFLNVDELLTDIEDTSISFDSMLKGSLFQSVYLSGTGDLPVVFDTGATISISPIKTDFEHWDSLDPNTHIRGIDSTTKVEGVGTVKWTVLDDKGRRQTIRTKAYYVPQATIRLLSPQVYLQQPENLHGGGCFAITDEGTIFVFPHSGGCRLTFRVDDLHKLPVASLVTRGGREAAFNVLADVNHNLLVEQKELLQWHFKLGHFNLAWIQSLTRIREGDLGPILPTRLKKATSCQLPKCAACEYAKAHRIPEGADVSKKLPEKDGILKDNVLKPGEVVSTDQYVSKLRGRLSTSKGKEREDERYCGGTIFVDHATGYMFVKNQVSLEADETLRSKHAFEREARDCGVNIRTYRADMGIYKSQKFQKDLLLLGQTMVFSGVGAHHQNGVAERAIRTISESARAMMRHAAIHWPDATTLDLWPLAVDYAVYLWNRMPAKDSRMSPMELFCGCKTDYNVLRSARVWGCPAYVLDPKIQDGKKLPRWQPKSRRGQFLGRSKRHASTIGLIRNLDSGSISTQFHVVYDDWFTTVVSGNGFEDVATPQQWIDLLATSRERVIDEADEAPRVADEWLNEAERQARRRLEATRRQQRNQVPDIPRNEVPEGDLQADDGAPPLDLHDGDEDVEVDNDDVEFGDGAGNEAPPLRRSLRARVPNMRYYGPEFANNVKELERDFGLLSQEEAFIASLEFDEPTRENTTPKSFELALYEALMASNMDDDGLLNALHPMAFAAKANSDDTPNFHQALNGPDSQGFYEAMEKEIEQLESMDPWEIVPIEKAKGHNILDSTWAFKRKRYPDGRVRKLKARWCVRGDQQLEGIDFFDTYAPVVSWSTVRLLLVLTVVLGLSTKQVDYTLAFVHAELKDEVYVRMPKMFEKEGHVYRLKKSVYGLRQSPLNFFNTLKDGLEARGFKQMKLLDPCLFCSDDVVCLTYVDDCLFFARDETAIDRVIESLGREEPTSFKLNIEDDVAGFLGILLAKNSDGTIELKQTGLIDRILKVMGLTDSKPNATPAEKTPLGKDEHGDQCQETWSYASVVGMMMYLSSNSRPDIAFAVHQAARFTHCPRRSHEQALKRIGRYLKGTRERGMVIRPTGDLTLDMFADADFAGLWNVEDATDPTCVRSRTGYIATLGGTPIIWGSKLQTEQSLSTTESEYIALSTAMRQLLPLRQMINEVAEIFGVERKRLTKLSTVWEDNNGALKMANASYPNMTPRSKHIAVKYHWFHSKLKPGEIEVKRIDTKVQKADIFTKGLTRKEYEDKRKMLMGW